MRAMKTRRILLREIAALCDEPGPEDGIDPRQGPRGRSRKHRKDRKTLQLCKQVEVAVQLALAASRDEDLATLTTLRVEPLKGVGRLLVLLCATNEADVIDVAEASTLVAGAEGRLRKAVADAIHRKRVPSLVFQYVPTAENGR